MEKWQFYIKLDFKAMCSVPSLFVFADMKTWRKPSRTDNIKTHLNRIYNCMELKATSENENKINSVDIVICRNLEQFEIDAFKNSQLVTLLPT